MDLGEQYLNKGDVERAVSCFKKSAEFGNAKAQRRLGYFILGKRNQGGQAGGGEVVPFGCRAGKFRCHLHAEEAGSNVKGRAKSIVTVFIKR